MTVGGVCVFLRLDNVIECYQTGYMDGGVLTWSGTEVGPCAGGVPVGRAWFNVTVEVRPHTADIFKDGRLTVMSTPRHVSHGSVGVVALNGHGSVVHFERLRLVETNPNYGQ